MTSILIADDTKAIRDILSNILSKEGYETAVAVDGTEAIEMMDAKAYDLVITDMLMPRQDGFAVVAHVKENAPNTKIIVMTGGGVTITPDEVIRSIGDEIEIFLIKPIGKSELLDAINKALGA